MKQMKKIAAILLALTLILVLAACSGGGKTSNNTTSPSPGTNSPAPSAPASTPSPGSPPPPPAPGLLAPGDVIDAPEDDNVTYADSIDCLSEGPVNFLDPHTPGAGATSTRVLYTMIYNKLINRIEGQGYFPELATSWSSDDMKTWTFKLREDDIYFHNGDKFTAQDVVDTVLNGKENPGSMAFDVWRDVASASVIDKNIVEIVLNAPNAAFEYSISLPGASIINVAARSADPVEGAWVGTGPYKVSKFVSGDHTTVVRNDDYWGGAPITRQVTFHFIPEVAARTIMMQNNEAQLAFHIVQTDVPKFIEDKENYIVYSYLSNACNSLAFNSYDPITSDMNFRMAVAHAVERTEIAIVAAGDWATPDVEGTYWGFGTEFRNHDIPIIPYNLDLAKEYLAKSVYNGEEIEIISGNVECNRAVEMVREQLGKIGIYIKLFQTDAQTINPMTAYGTKIQMVLYMGDFNSSAGSARRVFYPNGSSNRASYNNPVVNELLDKAPSTVDLKEREAIYRQVQEIVAEDLPYLNLYWMRRSVVTNSKLGGILINTDLCHDFRGIFLVVDD